MPLKTDFSFQQPVDAAAGLSNILGNLQGQLRDYEKQKFAEQSQADLLKQQAIENQRQEDILGMQKTKEKREVDEYTRKLLEREASDLYNKKLAEGLVPVSGWISPTGKFDKKFIDSISFFEEKTPVGTSRFKDITGKEISKEEAERRAAKQIEVGSLADNPAMRETRSEQLLRVMQGLSEAGKPISKEMREELLSAEAADQTALKTEASKAQESKNALLKDIREKEEKWSKFYSDKQSRGGSSGDGTGKSSTGGYNKENWFDSEKASKEKVALFGAGPGDADDVETLYSYGKSKGIPLIVVENVLSKNIEGGFFGNSVTDDNNQLTKALDVEYDMYKERTKKGGKGYGYDNTFENTLKRQIAEDKASVAALDEKLTKLGLSPTERRDLKAKSLLEGVVGSYGKREKTPVIPEKFTKEKTATEAKGKAPKEKAPKEKLNSGPDKFKLLDIPSDEKIPGLPPMFQTANPFATTSTITPKQQELIDMIVRDTNDKNDFARSEAIRKGEDFVQQENPYTGEITMVPSGAGAMEDMLIGPLLPIAGTKPISAMTKARLNTLKKVLNDRKIVQQARTARDFAAQTKNLGLDKPTFIRQNMPLGQSSYIKQAPDNMVPSKLTETARRISRELPKKFSESNIDRVKRIIAETEKQTGIKMTPEQINAMLGAIK